VLALLPWRWASGKARPCSSPLAIAIICGLVAHLPLVLLVLPVMLPRPAASDGRKQALEQATN
jgi:multidrug efflux pump subunit AcrB